MAIPPCLPWREFTTSQEIPSYMFFLTITPVYEILNNEDEFLEGVLSDLHFKAHRKYRNYSSDGEGRVP